MTRIHREMLDQGCTCHTHPPCSFCTSLTEEEMNVYCNYGITGLADHWRFVDEAAERQPNRYFRNILIIDANRMDSARDYQIPISVIASLDIMLVEHQEGYDIHKNRYGYSDYRLPKSKLPLFLMNPTLDYRT